MFSALSEANDEANLLLKIKLENKFLLSNKFLLFFFAMELNNYIYL